MTYSIVIELYLFATMIFLGVGLGLLLSLSAIPSFSDRQKKIMRNVSLFSLIVGAYTAYHVYDIYTFLPQDGLNNEVEIYQDEKDAEKSYNALIGTEHIEPLIHVINDQTNSMSLLHDDVAIERVRTIKKDGDKVLAELTLIDGPDKSYHDLMSQPTLHNMGTLHDNSYKIHKSFALIPEDQFQNIRFQIGLANDSINHNRIGQDKYTMSSEDNAKDLEEIRTMVKK